TEPGPIRSGDSGKPPGANSWSAELSPLARELLQHAEKMTAAEMLPFLFFDQRERWQTGERIPAEAYLRMLAGIPKGSECAFELIYSEFILREEMGEDPDLEDYLQRFPAFSGQLKRQVELHRILHPAEAAPQPPKTEVAE